MTQRRFNRFQGFTLAELLIALAILGVIATFTIPKVLNASTSGQNTAIAKEAASMISGAYSAYTLNNAVSAATTASSLTSVMNYVRVQSSTNSGGTNPVDCTTAGRVCLVLHSGAFLGYIAAQSFSGAATEYMVFNVDPDGTNTSVGGASIILYPNGRLTTGANATGAEGAGGASRIATDPTYMTW